jgi:hypothetical protein
MKKLTICALLACFCAAFAAPETVATINDSKIGADIPAGWSTTVKKDSPIKREIIQGAAENGKAFKVVSPAGASSSYWRSRPLPAKPGDTIKVTMDVTGKGRFNFGYYNYIGASKYFDAVDATERLTLDGSKKTIEHTFTVKPGKKGEVCENVRPTFWFGPDSEVIVDNFKFEVIKAK